MDEKRLIRSIERELAAWDGLEGMDATVAKAMAHALMMVIKREIVVLEAAYSAANAVQDRPVGSGGASG